MILIWSRILIFCQKFWNNDRILAKCHKIKNYKSINQAISEILKHFYVNINISLAFTPRMVFDSALFYQNLLQFDPSYSLALLKLPDYVIWLWRVVKSRFCHILILRTGFNWSTQPWFPSGSLYGGRTMMNSNLYSSHELGESRTNSD